MSSRPTKPPVFKDKAGRPLVPGDLIIYGHSTGHAPGLQYGKVLAVKWGAGDAESALPKITVSGVMFDEWFVPEPELLRASTLAYSSRTLKITRDAVEPRVLKLLDTVNVKPPEDPEDPEDP